MAFKRQSIEPLFDAWRACWNKWIQPAPFAQMPDPYKGSKGVNGVKIGGFFGVTMVVFEPFQLFPINNRTFGFLH